MKTKFLRRYTNLPFLFDMLQNKRLTLLDPEKWEDKNDSCFIKHYKKEKKLKTLLALCFTEADETFHHWKVFSDGSNGVCIQFKKNALLKHFSKADDSINIRTEKVKYKPIKDIDNNKIELLDVPFIKRLPYKDEKEFRIICESAKKILKYKHIEISSNSIDRIIVNPWISEPVFNSIKRTIKIISDCNELKVYKTTIIRNKQWENKVAAIVKQSL